MRPRIRPRVQIRGVQIRGVQIRGVQIRVDPIACDGRGLCAELLPEVITLDDWGYPVIHGDVPAGLRDEAAEAARLCPRLALRLTTETR